MSTDVSFSPCGWSVLNMGQSFGVTPPNVQPRWLLSEAMVVWPVTLGGGACGHREIRLLTQHEIMGRDG